MALLRPPSLPRPGQTVARAVHAIKWQLQHRYLSLETIAEIAAGEEPLEITQLPPKAA